MKKKTIDACFREGLQTKHKLQNIIKSTHKLSPNKKRKVNRGILKDIADYNRWVRRFLKRIADVLIIKPERR